MIPIGLFAILGAVTMWKAVSRHEEEVGIKVMVSFLIGIVGGLIGSMVAFAIGAGFEKAPEVYARHSLVNLRSSDGVSGSLFLGSGTIGTQRHYFWYQNAGSAVTPRQRPADRDTFVYEEDRTDAVLEASRQAFVSPWGDWFGLVNDPDYRYNFHVPKGTVQAQNVFTLQ